MELSSFNFPDQAWPMLQDVHALLTLNYRVNSQQLLHSILDSPLYQDPKRLERYGFKAYSQSDEDGFIKEIFNRIGIQHHTFIEFGVGDGLENNTVYLLYQQWRGLWIEAQTELCQFINSKFSSVIASKQLQIFNEFIYQDTINSIIARGGFEGEIDLLSIDIDGNDYHIWNAINIINPRIVVIEYNPKFGSSVRYVMGYDASYVWDGTDQYGASLKSLEQLGQAKGYQLVGCNIMGVNAFFVRSDLVGDYFQKPHTAENFYQPARYYLQPFYKMSGGYSANFGSHMV